jgi:hypothetical protein
MRLIQIPCSGFMAARLMPVDQGNHRRLERWLLSAAVLTALLAVVFWWRISQAEDTSFSSDPRFVITAPPTMGFSTTHASLTQRIFTTLLKLNRKPNPVSFTFPAGPANRCSIHGLLNQCMEVNGVRYVIARDVAAGTVWFGHTNSLSGPQWVLAFTEALQHDQPEFWDSQTKTFRKENLVLVTNSPRTVLVIPKSMAQEFQHEGK